MGEVRYPIRLYTYHDLDLVTFTLTHDFDIRRAIYCALKAFSKGEAFLIQIPPAVRSVAKFQRYYTKILILDTEDDQDVIDLLNLVEPGRRNNFIKNLLRLYLAYPFSEYFFKDEKSLKLFESKLEPFRTGKRQVRAGKTKSKATSVSDEKRRREFSSPIFEPAGPKIKRELSSPKKDPAVEPTPVVKEVQIEMESEGEHDTISQEEQDAILDLFNQL